MKIALITGASKGIGYTLANMLVSNDYKVIGIYNNTKVFSDLIDYQKCDISNEEEVEKLFNYIKDRYGALDILVNVAALSIDDDIYEKNAIDFMKVLSVNLVGTFLMCKYASLIMDYGVIVNVSSTNGLDTYTPISMDYDASKAGVDNLTKNLAMRLTNIKVCGIAPNWVDTDTTLSIDSNYLNMEMKRIGQKKLIKKEIVCEKIIEIIENKDIKSGTIIRMEDGNE